MKDIITDIVEDAHIKGIQFVRLQFVDILGYPKNIVIPITRLEEALKNGIPFDASSIAGYATIEESDKIAKPVPESYTVLPKKLTIRRTAKFVCNIYEPDGKRFSGDTKYVLEKVVEKASKMGFTFNTGPECEFFLFKIIDGKPTLVPNDHAGYFDLSHIDLAEGVRADIATTLEKLGIDMYTSHHEVSGGQHEINFKYDDAITTADRVITLKYVTKIIAKQHELHASFMPKPLFGVSGSGMHTHMSLFKGKKNMFYNEYLEHELSDQAVMFVAGILKNIKEVSAILNPTVNSYKRLVPGFEAPTYISWAHRNRSALIRIPAERGNGTRCELRNPDLSGNPYLQFAVMLECGLQGIKEKKMPPLPLEKNIYTLSKSERKKYNIQQLPESLGHALSLMEESELVKDTLGNHIFDNFLHVKRGEWEQYRMQVSKWEINKYLSIV